MLRVSQVTASQWNATSFILDDNWWDIAKLSNEEPKETTLSIREHEDPWRKTWIGSEIKVGKKYESLGEQQIDETIDAFGAKAWL